MERTFTVEEYQQMLASGNIVSGVVELLPAYDAPITTGTYRTRDGGTVTIVGYTRTDSRTCYATNGRWYDAETGAVLNASQFHGIAHPL